MQQSQSRFSWNLLHKWSFTLIVLMFAAGIGVVYGRFRLLSENLIKSKTLFDAEHYATVLQEFRTLYTSEVVERVRKKGIEVTHDYKGRDGAIPLPATLSLLLGERIAEHGGGAHARLYSPYPFPRRAAEGGLRDDFAKEAWISLKRNPDVPFYRFVEYEGRPSLRYATADVMRASCVNCHNTHPESPKTDWKEGDLRGILEIVFPMDRVAAATREGLRGTLGLMLGITALGVLFIALVMGRLKKTASDLERRISELNESATLIRTINENLEAARDEALSASRAKSQFLANMSHELRTPLNAIIGYSEMLMEEAPEMEPAAVHSDLTKINSAGKQLLSLVNNVLDMIKLEGGTMELTIETVALPEFMGEIAETTAAEVRRNSNTLEVRCAPDALLLRADRVKLRQCLLILIGNAAKFTREGRIEVDVSPGRIDERDWIAFKVRDTGIGMTSEQIGRLFQEFMQADDSSTRKYGGIGMGLALAEKLCRLMGGEITVESAPGRGSTFTIWLPVEGGSPAQAAILSETGTFFGTEASHGDMILVIEDDPQACELLARFLRKQGYRVTTVNNGKAGVELARELQPRVITLDVIMPETNGWAVLAALKSDPQTRDIPVVVISMVDDRSRGFALGAADYLVKPIDRGLLSRTLDKYRSGISAGAALIVEDDAATRELLARTLRKEGWTVEEAENGRDALERLAGREPDIILLDLMMPVMDGFQFMRELEALKTSKRIPVVVVTAKLLTDEDHRELTGHVERILQKGSYTSEELLAEILRQVRACIPPGKDSAT